MTTFTLLPKWYPVYAFPILVGTILLAFLLGKAIAWWDNFRVRRARARDNFSDEEAPYGTLAPRPLGPSRKPSRRNPSTRRALSAISEKFWEEDRTDRRQSGRQYNQRGKFVHRQPPVIHKPPVRIASERERDRYNTPTNHATYVKRSNSPRGIPIGKRAEDIEIHNTTNQQPRGRQGLSSTVYRAKGGPSAPPPPPPSPIPLFRPSEYEI
jgi:hypothetical protein